MILSEKQVNRVLTAASSLGTGISPEALYRFTQSRNTNDLSGTPLMGYVSALFVNSHDTLKADDIQSLRHLVATCVLPMCLAQESDGDSEDPDRTAVVRALAIADIYLLLSGGE
jgi:hypothetical protein